MRVEMITSPQNQWVLEAKKLKQKKYREARGQFLVEGLRLAEEAVKSGKVIEACLLYTSYFAPAPGRFGRGRIEIVREEHAISFLV